MKNCSIVSTTACTRLLPFADSCLDFSSRFVCCCLYREKQEFERLEVEIDKLTADKDSLEAQISQNAASDGGSVPHCDLSKSLNLF